MPVFASLVPSEAILSQFNMFCIPSLVKSLKAVMSTSENANLASARPKAIDARNEVPSKLNSGQPTEQPIDVIRAEKEHGILFFTGFSSILIRNGKYYMVLEARFRGVPHKTKLVSCPQSVHESDIPKEDREVLECKLRRVKGIIQESDWDKLEQRYGIIKEDWLVKDKRKKKLEI